MTKRESKGKARTSLPGQEPGRTQRGRPARLGRRRAQKPRTLYKADAKAAPRAVKELFQVTAF